MKLDILRKLIREEVKTAIKEELKDILTEAIIIASKPEEKNQSTFQPHTKIESTHKPKLSEVTTKKIVPTSTGNPLLDILNETAESGEWRSLNGGYNTSDAVNWAGGAPGMGGANTPVVETVDQMITRQGPVRDINDVSIDVVPDFTGLMGKLKENGNL